MAEEEKESPKPIDEIVEITTTEETKKPGGAVIHRKSVMERATDDIANEVVYDVVVPRGKDFLWDIGNGLLDILSDILGTALFGDRGPTKNVRRGRRGSSYVSYDSISRREMSHDRRDWERGSTLRRNRRRGYSADDFDLDDIKFQTRRRAEEVLSELMEYTMEYGQVTVDTYLQLADIPSNNAMDRKLGWDDLSDAQIRHNHGGFTIYLPRAKRLDLD